MSQASRYPWLPIATARALAMLALLISAWTSSPVFGNGPRQVVVLYPQNNDGSPGNFFVDQSIRSTIAAGSSTQVEIYNEYLDIAHLSEELDWQLQRDYLRRKYAGRKVDVVIAGLSSALDFVLAHRDIFPGAPVVFCAVDRREVESRSLPPDLIGVPIDFDLKKTLDVALRLHPDTESVAVVLGSSKMDLAWEAEARRVFQPYEDRLRFDYLTGLPLEELLRKVTTLPERSVTYYIHVFQDGAGRTLVPAHVLEALSHRANAPIYGHVDTYVGRGIVGGHVFSFAKPKGSTPRSSHCASWGAKLQKELECRKSAPMPACLTGVN